MATDLIRKSILKKYPDYDFNRYRFKFGDIVETKDLALVFVLQSGIIDCKCFVLKSSFNLRKGSTINIPYENLPYYPKGEFENKSYTLNKSIKWKVGDFVNDSTTNVIFLLTATSGRGFNGVVVEESEICRQGESYYVTSPYASYFRT